MLKNETGYPSIDKTHLQGVSYFKRKPFIPDLSFYNTLKLMSIFYRKEKAIDCLDLSVSYNELLENSVIVSKSFAELGIKAGDIITVAMPNFYQAVATYLAANRIGAVVTFLNSFANEEEIKHYLNLFESPLFINYDKSIEYNNSIKKDTKVRQIITLKKSDLNTKTFNNINISNDKIGYNDFLSFNDLQIVAKYCHNIIKTNFDGSQDSLILFTSGSTGNPKSVMLTNKNIMASGIYMKNTCSVKTKIGEKCLVCVPFSYPYGFATSALMSLLCGREAILAPNLSNEVISYYLTKNPNYVFGSPALLDLIMKNIPSNQDLSSIHTFISGGDTLFLNRINEAKDFFKKHGSNVEICNGSGNAETVGTSTSSVGTSVHYDTVGKVLIGQDVILIDSVENKKEVKYGEEGILCISGENVFKGYYGVYDLAHNDKFLYNGKVYYITGNKGILDKEGYFKLLGRDKRFFIRANLDKVYPEKLQAVISDIKGVSGCVVVPKPDDDLRYVNKAYVVLQHNMEENDLTKEYIMSELRKHGDVLKSFELPKEIDFIDELPRTKADKIDYKKLEDLALEEYQNCKILVKSL